MIPGMHGSECLPVTHTEEDQERREGALEKERGCVTEGEQNVKNQLVLGIFFFILVSIINDGCVLIG